MMAANNAAQVRMEGANGAMATTVGAGNALASGLSSIGNTASQYSLYNALLGGRSTASPASASTLTEADKGTESGTPIGVGGFY